jgi:S-disulfanyl-L-cysteine oxidoreductase SoxD
MARCTAPGRDPNFAAVIRTLFAVGALALPVAVASAQGADSATARAAASGVYSEEQAAKGKVAFETYCASCHSPTFHSDSTFRKSWFGRTVHDLFKVLKTTMPEDNVGGLSDEEYTRVIAYILQLNGFPAGKDSLRTDSTSLVRIKIGL